MTDQMIVPPGFEVPEHRVDREIYAMPAFTTLPVADLATATAWYAAMGFVVLAEMGDGLMRLVHLRRYRYQDLLLVPVQPGEPRPDGEPGPTAPRTSFCHAGPLGELDTIAAALADLETGSVAGPRLKPWHAVELDAVDADGHAVTLTARAETPPPPDLAARVRASRRDDAG